MGMIHGRVLDVGERGGLKEQVAHTGKRVGFPLVVLKAGFIPWVCRVAVVFKEWMSLGVLQKGV